MQTDFEVIYRAWLEPVMRWVRRMGIESDAEDVVQEVFVVVRRRLPDFDGHNLPGWLYRITRGRVRDYRRLRWSQVFSSSLPPDELLTDAKGPLEQLELNRSVADLEERLHRLSDGERAVLLSLVLHGCSGAELAAELRVPINTVWSRVRRARLKLLCRAARRAGSAASRRLPRGRETQRVAC